MKNEEILKLDSKLGDKFILMPCGKGDWILLRNNATARVIMSSNTNNEEELRNFVKEHNMYEPISFVRKSCLITNMIVLILCGISFYTRSEYIPYFNIGALLVLFLMLILTTILYEHNRKIEQKILEEDVEDYKKHQVIKKRSTKTSTRKPRVKGEEKKD